MGPRLSMALGGVYRVIRDIPRQAAHVAREEVDTIRAPG